MTSCSFMQPPRDLFTIMLKAFDRCSLMGCSLEPDPHVLEAKTSKVSREQSEHHSTVQGI